MQNFLHAVSDPREVTEAKIQLAEIARLSAVATASTGDQPK